MLFKRKSEEERSERHFTLTRRIYYIYILVTVYDLFMYLAGLVSVLSRPAAQTEIMDTGTHLWFYTLGGNFVRFPKEYLPFEVDAPSVDGKLFAAAFLLLTFIAHKLPIFFIVWKGYRILRAMKRSYTPFVPEIAEHICWIGRTALFIGLFGNLTIQGGNVPRVPAQIWVHESNRSVLDPGRSDPAAGQRYLQKGLYPSKRS